MGLESIATQFPQLSIEEIFEAQRIDQETQHNISATARCITKHLPRKYLTEGWIEKIYHRKDPVPNMMHPLSHAGKVIE
jgi:hypothetical protein